MISNPLLKKTWLNLGAETTKNVFGIDRLLWLWFMVCIYNVIYIYIIKDPLDGLIDVRRTMYNHYYSHCRFLLIPTNLILERVFKKAKNNDLAKEI